MLESHDVYAVELSALRDYELPGLMSAAASLHLERYSYVSVHAPSRFSELSESEISRLLAPCRDHGWPIVLHPDAIQDPAHWDGFGDLLCIENMDRRKLNGRTPKELERWFQRFPEASFCLDLGHTRQVDPSMTSAHEFVTRFGTRIKQIHLSELNTHSKHRPLSTSTVIALQDVSLRLPQVAIILESVVEESEIELELKMARSALEGGRTQSRGAAASM
jgi:hypothetical protein